MLPDRVSNPGPLTCESGALPTALRGPAANEVQSTLVISKLKGPAETLRDIRFSELRKIQIAQPNFENKFVIRLL